MNPLTCLHLDDPISLCDFSALIEDPVLVEYLLAQGADPNTRSDPGLNAAAARGSTATFALLLSHGARITESHPLHAAAAAEEDEGRIEMMTYLLGLDGIEINATDASRGPYAQGTPLMHAIASRGCAKIRLLVDRGALVDDRAIRQAEMYGVDEGIMSLLQINMAKD